MNMLRFNLMLNKLISLLYEIQGKLLFHFAYFTKSCLYSVSKVLISPSELLIYKVCLTLFKEQESSHNILKM